MRPGEYAWKLVDRATAGTHPHVSQEDRHAIVLNALELLMSAADHNIKIAAHALYHPLKGTHHD